MIYLKIRGNFKIKYMKKVKNKKKINVKVWIVVVLVIAALLIGLFAFTQKTNQLDKITQDYVETLSSSTVRNNVRPSFEDTYEAKDYTFYGETLSLFGNDYNSEDEELDPFMGKALVLHNIETGKEYNFTFSGNADGAIPLGQLDEGVYEIYVYDQYIKKRVYFDKPVVSDPFVSMRRGGQVKNIVLEADQDIFDSYHVDLDKNYAFLVIKDTIPQSEIVDVVIDPSGNVFNELTQEIELGSSNDQINETAASYELALKVKSELEKYGLKVLISRDDQSTPSYYGENGRVGIGYEHQAKIFLNLSMCDEENITRPFFIVSPLTNASLANEMAFIMTQNGIELDYPYTTTDLLASGVVYDNLLTDNDYNITNFSINPAIRESGGKATYTGQYNQVGNGVYSENYGMYGVMFVYANIANSDSISYYQSNQDTMAASLAQGIASYYQLKVVESDETASK